MPDSDVVNYINNARSQGADDNQIRNSLLGSGWTAAQIEPLLNPLMAPPPPAMAAAPLREAGHLGMWVTFQYVLMFITLACTAISLAGIAHTFVDNIFGSNLTNRSYYSYYSSYLITGYVATIIVSFPIFATLFVILKKRIELNPGLKNVRIRKVFIYIALVWTFLVMIARIIRVIYNFLFGNTDVVNSTAHLFVTLLIAGGIFLYFILDIKSDSKNI